MTFLNPLVLLGLVAAAIPIVLHLLNLRKLQTIEFSTLAFLKELQKNTMRKVKLRQWLLLIIRTLLIVLVVAAFSRPALRGTIGGIGSHAETTVVIIIDDSYSMSLHNDKGTFLKQAQSAALRIIDMLKEGDDALFIRLSELPQATIAEPTHDIQRLRDAVARTEPSYKHRTIEDALRLSSQLLQQSKNYNKEIYVFTDGQLTTINRITQIASQIQSQNQSQKEKLFESGVKVFVVPLSESSFENVGVEKVEFPATLLQKNKPFTVRAAIRNYGSSRVSNHLVDLYLDGSRVMQKSVSLDGGVQTTVDFVATPLHAGFVTGRVELEEDDFDQDNQDYFSLLVPDRIRITLISSSPQNSTYLKLALSSNNLEGTPIVLREMSPSQLATMNPNDADVILLSDVSGLSAAQTDQILRHVKQGGGVVFFPGQLTTSTKMTQMDVDLFTKLGLPSWLPVQHLPPNGPSFMSFEKIDFDHPVFRGMFEQSEKKQQKALESPRITSWTKFSSEKEVRSIISLSDGSPFLWEKISGPSRLLGFSVSANTDWSDFPLKGLFVPLLYQVMLYAASGENALAPVPPAVVGERVDIPLTRIRKKPAASNQRSVNGFRILDPTGKETAVRPYSMRSGGDDLSTVISYDGADKPGVYSVMQGKDTLAQFPMNLDRDESNGVRSSWSEITQMARRYGISEDAVIKVKDPETIDTVVLQSRYGIELWKYFLIAALVLALVEMAIARETKGDDRPVMP